MKKKQRQMRMTRAVVQLFFFIWAPQLFSTAFAGVKYIFQVAGNHQAIEWNSFLSTALALVLITCLFGRYFCGYACAFGALGDVLYELTLLIRQKLFHKKKRHGYPEDIVKKLQKIKYLVLTFLLVLCVSGKYAAFAGTSPWDVFSMVIRGRMPGKAYIIGVGILFLIMIGMCTQERFFCQFLCPMGAVFAILPIMPGALMKRDRNNCPPKCGLCKKRCPAHLDIDGDTGTSGECLCCGACVVTCPKENIR